MQNTRGAFQYYQNAFNSPLPSNYVNTIEEDKKLREQLKNKETLNQDFNSNNIPVEEEKAKPCVVSNETIEKIFKGCAIRGWIGLREL